jgi:hypothetical protein
MDARPLLTAMILCASATLVPAAAAAQSAIGVGVQAHSDDTTLKGQERIATQAPVDQDQELISDGTFSASLWYLKQYSERVRAGGGLRYYGTYGGLPALEEDRTADDDTPVPPYEFGTLLELYGQAEWVLPVSEGLKVDAVIGTQLGAQLLFPGAQLEEEIKRLEDQGAGVMGGPRVGFLFGPQVGARWTPIERVSVRLDVGVRYSRLFLFDTEEEVDGVAFKKEWDLNVLRTDIGLGVEINL